MGNENKPVFKSKMYQTLRSQPGAVSWPGAVMIPWGPYVGLWAKQPVGGRGQGRRRLMVWKRTGSIAEWRMSVPAGKGWQFRDNFAARMAAALTRPAAAGQPYRRVEGLVVSLYRQILQGIPADALKFLRSKQKVGERWESKVIPLRRAEMLRVCYFLGTKRAADLYQRDRQLALFLARKLPPGQPFAPSVRLDQILAKAAGLRRKEARRVLRWNNEWPHKNYPGAVKAALLIRGIGVAVTTAQAYQITTAIDNYDQSLLSLARPYMWEVLRQEDIHATLLSVRDELVHPLADGEELPKTLAGLLEKHQQRYEAMLARRPTAGTFGSPAPVDPVTRALNHYALGYMLPPTMLDDLRETLAESNDPLALLGNYPTRRHPVIPDDWSACGYRGRRLVNLQALSDESDAMSHCIRSHAYNQMMGSTVAYRVERFDGSDKHTIEVRVDGSIVDFRGRFNATPSAGATAAVKELFEQVGLTTYPSHWFGHLVVGVAAAPIARDEWGWVVRAGQPDVQANQMAG